MHLRQGRVEDLSQVADIGTQALWNDEITQYLAPNRDKYPLLHHDHNLYRTKKRFFEGDRLVVAVTDERDGSWSGKEEVTGFAYWSDTLNASRPVPLPSSILGNGFEQVVLRIEGLYRWFFNIDKSVDKIKLANFWRVLAEKPFFEDIPHFWELQVLAVSPKFQRKGVGSMLLYWGMEQASLHHLPVVVAATLNGECLYKKYGFTECAKIQLPDSDVTWAAMVWHPTANGISHSKSVDSILTSDPKVS